MSLHDELAPPIKCKLCAFLASLAPSQREQWEAELRLSVTEVSHARVVTALAKRDVFLDEASVRRHRRTHAA